MASQNRWLKGHMTRFFIFHKSNNDKEEQNITKSKTTESVEVPPHSHTTQATNATIANANRQEAKTKQKRTKKRDQYAFHGISYGIPPICLTFSQRVIIISKLQIRIKF